MNRVTVLAVAAAIGVAVLVKAAPTMSISTVICLIAFAVFFGSGGGTKGLIRSLCSLIAGAIWTVLANILVTAYESSLGDYRFVLFGIVALIIVLQSRVPLLSYIPGGLCGMALAGGTPAFRPYGLLVGIALVMGSVLGFAADAVTNMVAKKTA
jgi:hypothetical protein